MSRSQEVTIVKYARNDTINRYDFRFTIVWDTVLFPHIPNLKVYVMQGADDIQNRRALQYNVDYKIKVSPALGGTIMLINPSALEPQYGIFNYIMIEKAVPYSQPSSYVAPTSTDIISKLDLLVDQIQQLNARVYSLESINGIYKLNQDIQPDVPPIIGTPHVMGSVVVNNSADGTSLSGSQATIIGDTLNVPKSVTEKLTTDEIISRKTAATIIALKNQDTNSNETVEETGISSLSNVSNIILKILKGATDTTYRTIVKFTGDSAFLEVTKDQTVRVEPPHGQYSIMVAGDATGTFLTGSSSTLENGRLTVDQIVSGTLSVENITASEKIIAQEDITGQNISAMGSLTVARDATIAGAMTAIHVAVAGDTNGVNADFTGTINAADVNAKAAITAGTANIAGNITAGTANVTGAFTGVDMNAAGTITAGTITTGNITATTANFSGTTNFAGSASVLGTLTAVDLNVSGQLSVVDAVFIKTMDIEALMTAVNAKFTGTIDVDSVNVTNKLILNNGETAITTRAAPGSADGDIHYDISGHGSSAVGTEMAIVAVKHGVGNEWTFKLKPIALSSFSSVPAATTDTTEYQHISYDINLYEKNEK